MRERSLITLPVEQCAFFLHDSRERTIQIRHHHRDRGGVLFGAHTVRCLSRQFVERERDRGRSFCHSCGTEKSRKRKNQIIGGGFKNALIIPPTYQQPQLYQFEVSGGTLNVPAANQQCWDSELPCTNLPDSGVQYRGTSLQQGFSIKTQP